MWKNKVLFAALLTLVFATRTLAVTEHIEKMLPNDVMVDADIIMPDNNTYASYRVSFADYTQDAQRNASTLADGLFVDQAAARTVTETLDAYREGGVEVSNTAGEVVYSGQNGRISYGKKDVIHRYDYGRYVELVLLDLTDDKAQQSIAALSREEAVSIAERSIRPYTKGLELKLYDVIAITGEMLGAANDRIGQDSSVSFDQSDDQYLIQYGYTLDGLDVYSGLSEADQDIGRFALANELMFPANTQASVNQAGIYSLEIFQLDVLDEVKRQKVLTYDEALDVLGKFLDRQMLEFPLKIIDGWMEYLPIPDKGSFYEGEVRPFWCFRSSAYTSLIEDKMGWSPDRIYLVNAFTGKVRT